MQNMKCNGWIYYINEEGWVYYSVFGAGYRKVTIDGQSDQETSLY